MRNAILGVHSWLGNRSRNFSPTAAATAYSSFGVEVLVDADHDVGDERALRVGGGEGDVGLERLVEFAGLLVALAELVLGVGREGVIGVVADDRSVGVDGLVPLLQFLGELAEQVGDARRVFRIRVVLEQLAEDAAAGFEVDGGLLGRARACGGS